MLPTRGPKNEDLLDSQQVEILGRSKLKAALIEDGIEVATPERDNGIDLLAYWWDVSGVFGSRPIQMKAATNFSFGIDRKYERIPGLVVAFVMRVREPDHEIIALTYSDLVAVADELGWTKTDSWKDGDAYSTRHPAKRVIELLAAHRMRRGYWRRLLRPE